MGKRSDFAKLERDFYPTPREAVTVLAPFLPDSFTFCEPCAGNSRLTRHLEEIGGQVTAQYDISPQAAGIRRADARNMMSEHMGGAQMIITNPPWRREWLHPMILRFSRLGRTWLLLDADWAYTGQAGMFMDWRRGANRVHKIVAIGRLKWIDNSDDTGKDNCAWYCIGNPTSEPPQFFPRLDGG